MSFIDKIKIYFFFITKQTFCTSGLYERCVLLWKTLEDNRKCLLVKVVKSRLKMSNDYEKNAIGSRHNFISILILQVVRIILCFN